MSDNIFTQTTKTKIKVHGFKARQRFLIQATAPFQAHSPTQHLLVYADTPPAWWQRTRALRSFGLRKPILRRLHKHLHKRKLPYFRMCVLFGRDSASASGDLTVCWQRASQQFPRHWRPVEAGNSYRRGTQLVPVLQRANTIVANWRSVCQWVVSNSDPQVFCVQVNLWGTDTGVRSFHPSPYGGPPENTAIGAPPSATVLETGTHWLCCFKAGSANVISTTPSFHLMPVRCLCITCMWSELNSCHQQV